jgi:hypothetical protein
LGFSRRRVASEREVLGHRDVHDGLNAPGRREHLGFGLRSGFAHLGRDFTREVVRVVFERLGVPAQARRSVGRGSGRPLPLRPRRLDELSGDAHVIVSGNTRDDSTRRGVRDMNHIAANRCEGSTTAAGQDTRDARGRGHRVRHRVGVQGACGSAERDEEPSQTKKCATEST